MISISPPIRKLGVRVSKSNDTSYLAETDGEVNAVASASQSQQIRGYSDSNNPPTTELDRSTTGTASSHGTYDAAVGFQVVKGNYWKVTGASTVFWLPEF